MASKVSGTSSGGVLSGQPTGDPTSTNLAANIAKGIWYRRLTGQAFAAHLRDDNHVRAIALDPCTLEEIGPARIVGLEAFYCFYCRSADLAKVTGAAS